MRLDSYIREVGKLVSQGRTVRVLWGDERLNAAIPVSNVIRVDYDTGAGDTYEAPRGATQSNGAPVHWTKRTGLVAYIDASSTRTGATEADHGALCEDLVDAFLVALRKVAHSQHLQVDGIRGRFVDLGDDGTPVGARYELTFQLLRAVVDTPPPVVSGLTPAVTTSVDTGLVVEPVCP